MRVIKRRCDISNLICCRVYQEFRVIQALKEKMVKMDRQVLLVQWEQLGNVVKEVRHKIGTLSYSGKHDRAFSFHLTFAYYRIGALVFIPAIVALL